MKKLLTVFAFLLAFAPIFAQSKPNLDHMTFYKNGQTLDFYNDNGVVVYQAGQGAPTRKGDWYFVRQAGNDFGVNRTYYYDIKIEIPVGSRIVSMKGKVHYKHNGKVVKLIVDGEEWTFSNY